MMASSNSWLIETLGSTTAVIGLGATTLLLFGTTVLYLSTGGTASLFKENANGSVASGSASFSGRKSSVGTRDGADEVEKLDTVVSAESAFLSLFAFSCTS